jgi:hypothetical protein
MCIFSLFSCDISVMFPLLLCRVNNLLLTLKFEYNENHKNCTTKFGCHANHGIM